MCKTENEGLILKRSELEGYLGKNVSVYFHSSKDIYKGILTKCSHPCEKGLYYCKAKRVQDSETRFRSSYVHKITENM